MITNKPMTIEDFLFVMSFNADIYKDFAELPEEQKRIIAKFNIMSGVAQSFFNDGNLIGVAGIKYIGYGEAWAITLPDFREKKPKTLLRAAKEFFIKVVNEKNLWCIFASSRISKNFLKHLGFTESINAQKQKDDFLVWIKK